MSKKKTEIFRLTLSDGSTDGHIRSVKFKRVQVLITAITVIVVVSALYFVLISLTPIRTLIPGYPNAESKRKAVENAIRIDSLEIIIVRWEIYSENLLRVVNGEPPLQIDSLFGAKSLEYDYSQDAKVTAGSDSAIRALVASESRFEIRNTEERVLPLEGIHFFTPAKGVVSKEYDKFLHPYLEITTNENTAVSSVLEGTVVNTSWSDTDGYAISIQHPGDLITIYRHNARLMKKTGDKVNAGTTIGITGKASGSAGGGLLSFEMWHKGESVNPANYITF
ncbi:MAG: murein hydrolase activator EnvC family protein [Candidatus Cryptobacteroides sp.]